MVVEIYRRIEKSRRPYFVPARYSSNTHVRVYVDGELKHDILSGNHGGFKKVIEKIKNKYGSDAEYKIHKQIDTLYHG